MQSREAVCAFMVAVLPAGSASTGDRPEPAAPGPAGVVPPNSFSFYTVTPCRLFDSRDPALGGPNPLPAGTETVVPVVSHCGIPDAADAVSLNVTAVSPAASGHSKLYAAGSFPPETSVVNYSANKTRGNNAIVSLGQGGAIAAYVGQPSGTTHLVLDINGYFSNGAACSIWQSPPAPGLGVHTGNRTVFWDPVPGATGYDLYIREVVGSCGLLGPQMVTRNDQGFFGVTSPFDVSSFNTCNRCYYVDAVTHSGLCASPLSSDFGRPAQLSFSLLPCTP